MISDVAYLRLPDGERVRLGISAALPDVGTGVQPLADEETELPEAVKKLLKILTEGLGIHEFFFFGKLPRLRRNFHPPKRWKAVQDKRRSPDPLGRNTYLYKARKIKSLARSTHTRRALPRKCAETNDVAQCKHTFRITAAHCAPCSGYNVECKHYEESDAADTKHRSCK